MASTYPLLTYDEAYEIIEKVAIKPTYIGKVHLDIHPHPTVPLSYNGDPATGAEYYACSTEGCDKIWCKIWTKNPARKPPSLTDINVYKHHATKLPCLECDRKQKLEASLAHSARQRARVQEQAKEHWEEIDLDQPETHDPAKELWDKILEGEAEEEWEIV